MASQRRESDLMTIQEMIDAAFDGYDTNVVNFKLLRTIFYIIAQKLRLLDRRVEVSKSRYAALSLAKTSNLVVDHVRMVAEVQKRGRPSMTSSSLIKPDTSTINAMGSSTQRTVTGAVDVTVNVALPDETKIGASQDGAEGADSAADAKRFNIMGADSASDVRTKGISKDSPSARRYGDVSPDDKTQSSTISSQEEPVVSASVVGGFEATPAPIRTELRKEKLIIVGPRTGDGARLSTEQIAVVTKEEFNALKEQVSELADKFLPTGLAALPENIELMKELRKGASLTTAMAALQLSIRLEGTEKTLSKMTEVVTGLAKRTGLKVSKDNTLEVLFQNLNKTKEIKLPKKIIKLESEDSTQQSQPSTKLIQQKRKSVVTDSSKAMSDEVTFGELSEILKDFSGDVEKTVANLISKNKVTIETAIKTANQIETKLMGFVSMGKKMEDLEAIVSEYADKVTILDTSLSSQMTNYQEQLTQMQHDLEAGIENMAEAVANAGGDTTAVMELNNHFNSLQIDLDQMATYQKEFQEVENLLTCDVQGLWRQVEFLKAAKSDREEVEDALRDKAGIELLNGLVTMNQFEAVKGDLETRLTYSYNLFNNQELVWQKIIDDVLKVLNEKADIVQVVSLVNSVRANIQKLEKRLDYMLDVVGEPTAAATTRKIHRNAACISCASPAHMRLEEANIPALPAFRPTDARPPAVGAEDVPKDSGDHTLLCYRGRKITHPLDERAKYCHRYCGGSHTVVQSSLTRAPQSMTINALSGEPSIEVGTDGKVYRVANMPCKACNFKADLPSASVATEPQEQARVPGDNGDMTPSDYRNDTTSMQPNAESFAATPPMCLE